MRKTVQILLYLFAGASLALSAGCGLSGSTTENQAFDTPAQVLATEAEQLYRDGEFGESAEMFQQLKERYPLTRYKLLADLRVGDAYFKSARYEEAILAYDDFIRLHPKNEAVPYAIYQTGMVYHSQMMGVDRDPTNARKAAETFERLAKQYPKSEWAQKAKPRWEESLQVLAGHDFYVGRFYYRTKQYKAAVIRFKRVLTQYPDVGLYGDAMSYIQQSEEQLAKLGRTTGKDGLPERRDLTRPPSDFERPDIFNTGSSMDDGTDNDSIFNPGR